MIKLFKRKKKERKSPPPIIDKSEMLSIIPVRNPLIKWEKDESGDVIIYFEQKPSKIIRAFTGSKTMQKKIVLDNIGSYVWELCNGKNSVNDIISGLMEKYKLRRIEAEKSLILFLQMLSRKTLIGFLPGKK